MSENLTALHLQNKYPVRLPCCLHVVLWSNKSLLSKRKRELRPERK